MSKKKVESLADTTVQVRNTNKHTQRGMGMLEKGISERKWIGAITAAADGEIFDGSARREVLEAIGVEDAIVVHGDGTRPLIYIRDDIPTADDPRAVQLALEANRIAQLNLSYDAGVLAELGEEGVDLSSMFFPHELAAILEQAGTEILDANELWKGMPEFEQDDLEAYKKTVVHFANEDDYQAFFRLVGQPPNAKAIWFPPQANVSMGLQVEDES